MTPRQPFTAVLKRHRQTQQLPNESGTYVLLLQNRHSESIRIGRLGYLPIGPGYYLYVGSAFGPGGLRARLTHHLKHAPKPHWHIDYLRRYVELVNVWYQGHCVPQEHRWALALGRGRNIGIAAARFGSSDCRCASHLFFSATLPTVQAFRRRLRSVSSEQGVQQWSPLLT